MSEDPPDSTARAQPERGGLLGAAITAPHLAGPFIGRLLDTARDGRTVIAWACVAHGVTLAAAVLLYPYTWWVVTALLLIAAGLVGPLLTGGISSRLHAIAGPDRASQRRAQGWDVATYGIGGTIGPSLVAAIAASVNPAAAALVLAAGTFFAAAIVRLLPYAAPPAAPNEVPRPGRTLALMLSTGPLRRTLYLTVIVAFSVAVLPITAVAAAGPLGIDPAAAGILIAAYGLGGLAGSAVLMVKPLRGDADQSLTLLAAIVAVTLGLVTLAGVFWIAVAAYAAAGIANSLFFAATLAARSEYAPPQARGQVFVWVGALKIAAGSAGTAFAGAIIATALHAPLLIAIAVTLLAAAVSLLERTRRRGPL